ncbi:MAG: peptide ABC transporter substrate-binding protein [Myxococcota bacterium]
MKPADVVAALQRVATSRTPYRALLTGVAGWKAGPLHVDLTLSGPTADLPRALCHPAFSLAMGPFTAGAKPEANPDFPEGRPFLDAVSLATADARAAERLFAQRKAALLVGAATPADDAPQLFVTVLVFPPALAPHLPAAIESTIDRGDLVRFFLKPPSAPLAGLLPPSLGGTTDAPSRPARPSPLTPAQEIAVAWDSSNDGERAIAERLQVKLQPLGYRVALKASPRDAVRAREPASPELTLQSLLLPPSPAAALAVLLEASGQRARIGPALAAVAAAADPDARARELAVELLPQLPLLPLVTRGVGVSAARDVQHLTRDALGLPRLDDAFLAPE